MVAKYVRSYESKRGLDLFLYSSHSHFLTKCSLSFRWTFPSKFQFLEDLLVTMTSSKCNTSLSEATSSSCSSNNSRSLVEKLLSFMFDGPSGTRASKNDRELRDKYEEDKLDVPRTEEEERQRQKRVQKRADIVGGGDGVRTNDMQKEGWGGANLALGHA
jgi:hypothetical protein